jgi:hypothetical protein
MRTQKKSTVPYYTNMVEALLDRVPIYKSGTYNNADPTHYEKGSLEVAVGNQRYLIETNDVTWGIEIHIYRLIKQNFRGMCRRGHMGKYTQELRANLYYSRAFGGGQDELINRTRHHHVPTLIRTLLKAISPKVEKPPYKAKSFEEWNNIQEMQAWEASMYANCL